MPIGAMPSSVIRFHRYDADTRTLLIVFTSGRRYVYRDVPAEIAIAFGDADSKGTFFNAEIRDRFDYEEMD